jgi:serine/threonine-protein kinase HipA
VPDREGRRIEVWADWLQLGHPTAVGTLFARPLRGAEVYSFEYDAGWLTHPSALAIDPGLQLFAGPQYAAETEANFGIFLDSSPDRWGRILMRRREVLEARRQARRARVLRESDYLLGVHDAQRMGGLRFRTDPEGPFLDNRAELAAPPTARIRELEFASLKLEEEGVEDDPEYANWLRLLIAPGSSLGGSHPKASVTDTQGALWIAKFPSKQDTVDRGAWEFIVHELARRAGVEVAAARCQRFTSAHHTFLTRRFDRTDAGERIHFMSAMAALRKRDREEASYLEVAEFLMQNGSRVPHDLEELWRRIVFFMCVSNNDDHLRNHGFLLRDGGWRLAPAYDVNPVEQPRGHSLNVSDTDNAQDLDLAREVAAYFRVDAQPADAIIAAVVNAVNAWRDVATTTGLSRRAQDEMAPAFALAESERAVR